MKELFIYLQKTFGEERIRNLKKQKVSEINRYIFLFCDRKEAYIFHKLFYKPLRNLFFKPRRLLIGLTPNGFEDYGKFSRILGNTTLHKTFVKIFLTFEKMFLNIVQDSIMKQDSRLYTKHLDYTLHQGTI